MRPLSLLLLGAALSLAADPPKTPAPLPGEKMIRAYFQRQSKEIADAELRDIKTLADWEKARPVLRQQLLEMLGLWPLPQRTDLKATVTGKVETPKFTVEKLHFQSMPGLYVTGNLYVPKPAPTKAPTVLYVCGHGNFVKDGISYGSKVPYQHHPAWFAEHGYVALVIDTLQLSEIPGLHHGTYREKMWWWHTLGYTPAGVECWNAMRALDYLETRPEVDARRIGVTGRSGGGAYSWWIAATDDRIQCAIPVAGIADLQAHLNEGYPGRLEKGVIAGHCDCMFMTNTYRWDFATVAALVAPRPLMLGNSDEDDIFPVPGYRRMSEKVRKIYELYGAGSKFTLLETKGKHVDTPELRAGAFRWMNKWLKDDPTEVDPDKPELLDAKQLKVFDKAPADERNTTIQNTFIKAAEVELPKSPEVIKGWWPGQREKMMTALKDQVFRGWPGKVPDLNLKPAGDKTHEGVRLRAWDFTSEEGVELRLWLMTAPGDAKPAMIVLNTLGDADWSEWCADLGPEFAELLQLPKAPKRNDAKFKQNAEVMKRQNWAFAAVCPRGVGPTQWAEPGSPTDVQYRRRFALVGQSLDGMRVWDTRRAVQALQAATKDTPIWLQGKKDLAGVALYAALYEPAVARLDLWYPPASHKEGPALLNVRKHMDMPQAVALLNPRPVRLFVKDADAAKVWAWPVDLQTGLGAGDLKVNVVGE
ncbi:MAG TPA: prolyl oligopeptidase family serine peptidase [Gemmataceae bacterium]|nr:prolyl oligopeptidase family serine peptidase [Gemmataceae bacterium]